MNMNEIDSKAIQAAAALLDDHPDFQVVRRFSAKAAYAEPVPGLRLAKGVILDTETTGRDVNKDKIIELGMIVFEFDPLTGQAYRILETYDCLEDPGMPIDPAATKVNGITDDMVKGQRIDDAKVEALVMDADIIIAHNSQFDRPFMERRMPIFKNKPWGCSRMQINWDEEGIASQKLDYISYRLGFFYEAHRAEADCQALLEMLQKPLPETGTLGLKHIVDNYRKAEINVAAVGAPFDKKDLLKARGYRWNGEDKFWHTLVTDETYEEELNWIRESIYHGKPFRVSILKVDAFSRFSDRKSERELVFA